jgi:hypothetical protein
MKSFPFLMSEALVILENEVFRCLRRGLQYDDQFSANDKSLAKFRIQEQKVTGLVARLQGRATSTAHLTITAQAAGQTVSIG